jgi:hypothetical protein
MLLEAGYPLTMSVRGSIHILRNLRKSLRNMRKPAAPSPGFVSMMLCFPLWNDLLRRSLRHWHLLWLSGT